MIWTDLVRIALWTCACGLAWSAPAPVGSNGTELERRWETLLSRSYLGAPGIGPEPRWESDYLQGIKRVRRLYCNVGIGFHLQVLPDGRVSGTHSENQHSLIEISTVDRGVISLFGLHSQMFVAMNGRGRLYGTGLLVSISSSHLALDRAYTPDRAPVHHRRVFRDECKFKETLLPNNYNAYESFVYKGFYIALSKRGRVKRGNKASTAMTVTHFLPRL